MGENKEYYHRNISLGYMSPDASMEMWDFHFSPLTTREEFVPVGERRVLALQKKTEHSIYTLVPGYAIKTNSKKHDPTVTEIETIDKQDRKDVESALRKAGFEGPINYW